MPPYRTIPSNEEPKRVDTNLIMSHNTYVRDVDGGRCTAKTTFHLKKLCA
jgi:hypothetical protein